MGVAGQIDAADMVAIPRLPVAVGKLMVDPFDHVVAVQHVPGVGVVGMNLGAGRNVVVDPMTRHATWMRVTNIVTF